jgi:hypothetical protein
LLSVRTLSASGVDGVSRRCLRSELATALRGPQLPPRLRDLPVPVEAIDDAVHRRWIDVHSLPSSDAVIPGRCLTGSRTCSRRWPRRAGVRRLPVAAGRRGLGAAAACGRRRRGRTAEPSAPPGVRLCRLGSASSSLYSRAIGSSSASRSTTRRSTERRSSRTDLSLPLNNFLDRSDAMCLKLTVTSAQRSPCARASRTTDHTAPEEGPWRQLDPRSGPLELAPAHMPTRCRDDRILGVQPDS